MAFLQDYQLIPCARTKELIKDLFGQSLSNAHSPRDLTFVKEHFDQDWSEEMAELLLKMKAAKEKAISKGKQGFHKSALQKYRKQYNLFFAKGLKQTLSN